MSGLKDSFPEVQFAGNKVTPDEMDLDQQYVVLHPAVGTRYFGHGGTGTVAVAFTLAATVADYPRNLAYAVIGPSGGVGGTAIVNGVDQFGGTMQETITIASANGGGTSEGTKVFWKVTSGTHYPNGGDNTGTVSLGVALGTSATSPIFGLPAKLGTTTDVKSVTWDDNTVSKPMTSFTAVPARNGVVLEMAGGVAAADCYIFKYRSTYNSSGLAQISNS